MSRGACVSRWSCRPSRWGDWISCGAPILTRFAQAVAELTGLVDEDPLIADSFAAWMRTWRSGRWV
jgi:hypothetical protein